MKKIALYGGSFDPPHLGHVIVVNALLNSREVDEIWFVPVGKNPRKPLYASAQDRKSMISILREEMFSVNSPILLEWSQMEEEGVSLTYELFAQMERLHPQHKFYMVIGSDLIEDIPNWSHAGELMQKRTFLAVPRLGQKTKGAKSYVHYLASQKIANSDISSTLLRELIAKGKRIDGLTSGGVARFIQKKGLYQASE